MESTPVPKAYSYLRFSTPEQMQGDSFRRQTALAETYALQHGLELDTDLTFHDLGVSAFRGQNASPEGQLGTFREAVSQGIVPQGSYLLVESLDRISRQTARRALRLLEDVVDAGVTVVTLNDGRKYTKEELDRDQVTLLISILTFMRAHEESVMKASRLKAAWTEKRIQASECRKPLTKTCPAWLTLDGSSGIYKLIPERAQIVQRIFAMTLEGVGQGSITQTFNQEGIKPFGRGKHWHRSYIAKILENAAVQGTFIPHVQDHNTGKKVRRPLDPIADYFPAVIDAETIERLQVMRERSVDPRRGRHAAKPLNNMFGGLMRCAICGGSVTRTNKGDGNKYFVCSRAKAGAGCTYRTIRYQQVEECFLELWGEILAAAPDMTDESTRVLSNLKTLHTHLEWLDVTIAGLVETIENSAPSGVPVTLLDRLRQLEYDRTQTMDSQRLNLQRKQALEKNMISLRLTTLHSHLLEIPIEKAKVNATMRQLFSAITISHEAQTLEFQWHHSTEKTLMRFSGDTKHRVIKLASEVKAPPFTLAVTPMIPFAPS